MQPDSAKASLALARSRLVDLIAIVIGLFRERLAGCARSAAGRGVPHTAASLVAGHLLQQQGPGGRAAAHTGETARCRSSLLMKHVQNKSQGSSRALGMRRNTVHLQACVGVGSLGLHTVRWLLCHSQPSVAPADDGLGAAEEIIDCASNARQITGKASCLGTRHTSRYSARRRPCA